jgi:hypothetical protein
MSTTVSGAGTTAVSDLANSLLKVFDKNGDQQLSASEFESFLDQLLGQVVGSGTRSTLGTSLATDPGASNAIQSGENPPDYLLRLLNSGRFQNPHEAIDVYNAQNIPGNHYGTSPAYYPANNTIGLPTYYLINVDGQWQTVQRGR